MRSDKSLFILETKTIVSGYRALDVATRQQGVRVLEASPCGGGKFLLIAKGSAQVLASCRLAILTDLMPSGEVVDSEIVSLASEEIEKAFYSLQQQPLEESLLVIESNTLAGLLYFADEFVGRLGLMPIEIKVQRSSIGSAYGFFTGSSDQCRAATAVTMVVPTAGTTDTGLSAAGQVVVGSVARTITSIVINQPAESFRSFFNISG
jgi:microcompartment protein CcmL/EutN